MITFQTTHLSKSFGSHKVLDDVNICVREGDIYGLVGRNGAGKTTLIKILLGLANPTEGQISINGATTKDALCYERKKIGSIIDSPSLILHMTALDNMKAVSLSMGVFDLEKSRELLHKVGLDPDNPTKVKNYSLGMKQRLAIAIALIDDPKVLVLDEPVNGLDPTGIFEVRELLQRLNREDNVTILISSHLLAELGKLATCYGVIEKGKLVKEMRESDLEMLCRPYIKVVVGDLKVALNVVVENFHAEDFEILPYNTLAIYDLSKSIPEVAGLFSNANCPIMSITQCEGDLESTFISMMGGLSNAQD